MRESQLQPETQAANKAWMTQLNVNERSTLVATFAGWMLDGMDVMVYSLVLPTLISLWHISKGEAGLLGTSALLLSSLGGWLAGLAADPYGRVRVLQLTILWFAFFTFLSGFANGFTQLLIFRGLQGLGFGGEWAVGSVLIGETIRSQYRGRAVGTVQSGWAIGWGISALFYTLFFAVLPPWLAWRGMFWVGLLPALLVVRIRSHVSESTVFERSLAVKKAAKKTESSTHFLQIFSPALLRTTLLASLVALGAQGGYYAITTWLPLYLNARVLSLTNTGGHLLVVIAGSFAGYLTAAHLADGIGRKGTLTLFAVLSFTTVLLYTVLPISDHVTLLLGFPLGFFPSGAFSPDGGIFH
jgi:MFS family permease